MSAVVPKNGPGRRLDRPAEPREQVTPEDAKDPERVSRLLQRILRELAELQRRFWPKRIDVEDRAVDATGTTLYRFPHGLGGRVRWYPIGWSGGSAGPSLVENAATDGNTLVLVSHVAGTLTLRIEEAG